MNITLKDGSVAHVNCTVRQVTSNCGMRELSGFTFRVVNSKAPKHAWGPSYTDNAVAHKLFQENEDFIIRKVCDIVGSWLVVMSDYMGGSSMPLGEHNGVCTRDLMKLLIRRRVGSITLSPLMQNYSYARGQHEIQSLFWAPPKAVPGILLEGRVLPLKGGTTRRGIGAIRTYNRQVFGT